MTDADLRGKRALVTGVVAFVATDLFARDPVDVLSRLIRQCTSAA